MKFNVSATRMGLLKLKKRLVLARRGHKLLKDKLDELLRRFMEMIKDYKELREEMERAISDALRGFLLARAVMSPETISESLIAPQGQVNLTAQTVNIMNIAVPCFELQVEGEFCHYGFAETAFDLDASLDLFSKALPLMIKVAEKEKTIELLAEEIEKTRRRVNALEYVLIPGLQETIKHISMRLEELERSNLTRLMKVKDIVRAH
jgi:V/A-type H+-transporting ATPase subunit D